MVGKCAKRNLALIEARLSMSAGSSCGSAPSDRKGIGGLATFTFPMNYLSVFLTLCFATPAAAQTTYTGHLRKTEPGKGVVVIVQSDDIERVVNQSMPPQSDKKTAPKTSGAKPKPAVTHEEKGHAGNRDAQGAHGAATHGKTPAETSANNAGGHSGESVPRHYTERSRRKARGFRICIFTGGNSRADREKAVAMGNKCRTKFPELSAYPVFVAPRWATYVGDFRTRQDAQKYVSRIHKARFTYEVRIVSSEVNLPY